MNEVDATKSANSQVAGENYKSLFLKLDLDPALAAEKFATLRRKLIVFFDKRGCIDPEFQADEAFTRAALSSELANISDLAKFIYEVARRQAMEVHRRQMRAPLPLLDIERHNSDLEDRTNMSDSSLREMRLGCLELCLRRLPEGDRKLLLDYYREQKSESRRLRRFLADRLGIKPGTLRTRLTRARQGISNCCEKCMQARQSKSTVF